MVVSYKELVLGASALIGVVFRIARIGSYTVCVLFSWNVHSEVTSGLARAFYMNGTFNLQGTVTFSLQGTVTFRLQARATILRERSPGSVTVNGYVTDTLPKLPRAAESTGTGTGPCQC